MLALSIAPQDLILLNFIDTHREKMQFGITPHDFVYTANDQTITSGEVMQHISKLISHSITIHRQFTQVSA